MSIDQEGCSDTPVKISSNRCSSEVMVSNPVDISVDDDEAVDDNEAVNDVGAAVEDVAIVAGVTMLECLIKLLSVTETGSF